MCEFMQRYTHNALQKSIEFIYIFILINICYEWIRRKFKRAFIFNTSLHALVQVIQKIVQDSHLTSHGLEIK